MGAAGPCGLPFGAAAFIGGTLPARTWGTRRGVPRNGMGRRGKAGAKTAMHDPVLTVDEVAHEMRCSKPHVYHAINGTAPGVSPLPAIRFGRRRLVLRSTLDLWKKENNLGVER